MPDLHVPKPGESLMKRTPGSGPGVDRGTPQR
jgi:hypothetical protein